MTKTKTKTKDKTILKPFASFYNAPQCKSMSEEHWFKNSNVQEQSRYWQTLAILLERRLTNANKLIDNIDLVE
jgi:hypothetical protein